MSTKDAATEPRPVSPIKQLEGTQMYLAYEMLEKAIAVSKSSRALVVWREALRSPPQEGDMAAASLALVGLLFLTHWWVALPVSGAVVLWRTRRRALKMRRTAKSRPHSRPDIHEFQNLWAVNSWKLVPLVRGFNYRVTATNLLIRDYQKLHAVRKMTELLHANRQQLVKAWELLEQLQPVKVDTATKVEFISLHVDHTVNARLTTINPLGVSVGSTDPDWLATVTEPIHPDRFEDVLRRDIAQQEIRESSTDSRFEDLESKYGADLDRDLGK